LQQPLGQLLGPQVGATHWPLEQMEPPVQVAHAAPPVPQAVLFVHGWQAPLPSMQPPQVAPWHTPVALQVRLAEHFTHATPLTPQALLAVEPTPGVWQVSLLSQQPVQLDELQVDDVHWPLEQDCPWPQTLQAFPPAPQADGVLPGWQLPLASTHPLQPDEVQVPLAQVCVPLQTAQAPPLVPQAAVVLEGLMQVPLGVQQPEQLEGPHPGAVVH
jgi:hypothetical protein